jgi:phosphohistidine phosphatase
MVGSQPFGFAPAAANRYLEPMEFVVIMRHAKAERNGPDGSDFSRPLAPRGREQARRVGTRLAGHHLLPSYALVSGAARTRETWAEVSRAFPDCSVRFDDRIYSATSDELLSYIEAELEAEKSGGLMVIGHNPTVHELCLDLMVQASAAPGDRARVASGFPTATAVVFRVDVAGRLEFDGLYRTSDEET